MLILPWKIQNFIMLLGKSIWQDSTTIHRGVGSPIPPYWTAWSDHTNRAKVFCIPSVRIGVFFIFISIKFSHNRCTVIIILYCVRRIAIWVLSIKQGGIIIHLSEEHKELWRTVLYWWEYSSTSRGWVVPSSGEYANNYVWLTKVGFTNAIFQRWSQKLIPAEICNTWYLR